MNITSNRPIAYFCAEFGIQANLPIYAGGLGVLAGDTIKEAADQELPLVGVGLLYRGGKAIQKLDPSGMQYEEDMTIDPVACGLEHVFVPHEDQPLFVRIHLTTIDVWARVWRKTIGSVQLYLLDTDTDQNQPSERGINAALYLGSEEILIKQQMVLGIGGVKLLEALEIHPGAYHVNEGRPAFLHWQLIRQFMERGGLTYQEAREKAMAMTVYTNHTLVRAGNQDYDTTRLREYGQYYAIKMGVTIDELLAPGIEETTKKFSLTKYALNSSARASAVSQPHFEISRNLWPEFAWEQITNGVHMPTWQDPEITSANLDDASLWEIHKRNKRKLMEYVLTRSGYGYDPERLVVVWARRVAGYKRMQAIFEDINNLKMMLTAAKTPVQLLMAGKAHANDTAAKQILKDVITTMSRDLPDYAIFVPNYDLETAQMLSRGADVWLNTPISGQEASGTSGMKALANGVLQLTVADGWAAEVDWRDLGWTLDANHIAQTFYFRMQQDIVPEFYDRDKNGVPLAWLQRMKEGVVLAQKYSTTRMLEEYRQKLYEKVYRVD